MEIKYFIVSNFILYIYVIYWRQKKLKIGMLRIILIDDISM